MNKVKRKSVMNPTEIFKRDTQGMTGSQKMEYLKMNSIDQAKFVASVRVSNAAKLKEKEDKEKENQKDNDPNKKHAPVKIIKEGQVCVHVLNMRGKPLMPTSPVKARALLKKGKAKVVQRNPFTIQLKYPTGENRQPIVFALDPGYKTVGFSAVTKKRELISGETILRTDVSERITEKSMYRKGRRNRNTRYRKPRFDNRGNKKGKKAGWLAPSIQHKLDTYVNLIRKFDKILPITHINIETSPFDTQKMQNPEISGIEYQHGTLQGYEIKEYLLEKFGRKCVYCGDENVPLETEHIIPPSRNIGGTDRVSNLTIACHDCNQDKGDKTAAEFGHPEVQMMAKRPLKAAAFMNIVRSRLVDMIKKEFPQYYCESIYGYVTKYNRNKLGLEKTHANDAFVIAEGSGQIRSKPYIVKQIRRNDRSLQLNRKGHKPSIRTKRYKIKPGDLVKKVILSRSMGWNDELIKDRTVYTVKGVFNYGDWVRLTNPIPEEKGINIKTSDVNILKYGSGLLFQLPKSIKVQKQLLANYQLENKDKIKKLSKAEKEEQKVIDMKKQKTVYDM